MGKGLEGIRLCVVCVVCVLTVLRSGRWPWYGMYRVSVCSMAVYFVVTCVEKKVER